MRKILDLVGAAWTTTQLAQILRADLTAAFDRIVRDHF